MKRRLPTEMSGLEPARRRCPAAAGLQAFRLGQPQAPAVTRAVARTIDRGHDVHETGARAPPPRPPQLAIQITVTRSRGNAGVLANLRAVCSCTAGRCFCAGVVLRAAYRQALSRYPRSSLTGDSGEQ